ncbi:MAG: BON domain-containing protein [Alphaproteobacteria bacterium]|nr:BON domain-containing protein [Alphaproteobacteria bacterium]
MADRWMDERDRRWRERDWRRSEDADRRFSGGEGRSFRDDDYEARLSGSDRDRVFGERESGVSYGGRGMRPGGGAYGAGGRYGSGEGYRENYGRGGEREAGWRRGGWQDRNYGGVSPAMEQGEYDAERRAERYDREHESGRRGQGRYDQGRYEQGGRYLGDDGRTGIYRQEYGQGGVEYGPEPRGYDADRDRRRDRQRDHRGGHFAEDYSGSMFGSGALTSGGTGGYDYERGYGDGGPRADEGRYGRSSGGREDDRGERWEQRGHEMGRDTGDFFRRAGERISSWFGGGGETGGRDFRGMGPKGYKRADERISEEVHERLTDDSWVDASNISVSVSGGEVTLSGTVENREAKHRAERIVEDISGVSHVQNNLRVDKGNPLTSASRGYGDSVLEAQMRGETGSADTSRINRGNGDGGTSASNRTSGADAGKSR